MKKDAAFFVFFIGFLFIFMPNAYSIYEELIYSGSINDRDVVKIANSIFEFRIDSKSNKVYAEADFSAVIIASGECEIKDGFDICIRNISFSYRNYTEWYDVYKADVDIYQIKSKLAVEKKIEKSDILMDEGTIAELSIENTADITAEDVVATIKIPPSILITEVEGCKQTYDGIVFNADVHPRQIRKCTYKLEGINAGKFELIANITYFDGAETISTTSNTVSARVYNYSLKITPKLNKSKFNIGEKLNLTIDIKNINGQYDLDITTLNIKIPEKLLIVKSPKDTAGNRIINWNGALKPEESKSFVMELQSHVTGNYSILTEASYIISKFLRRTSKSAGIEVYCDCPYIKYELPYDISAGQSVKLAVYLLNPSPVNNFRNVKIDSVSNIPDLINRSTVYSQIKANEKIRVFDSLITAPPLSQTYFFNITAVYESQGNQVFVAKEGIIIKIPEKEEKSGEKEILESGIKNRGGVNATDELEPEVKETETITIKAEKEKPIKAYGLLAFISSVIFIFALIFVLKKRKEIDVEKPPEPR